MSAFIVRAAAQSYLCPYRKSVRTETLLDFLDTRKEITDKEIADLNLEVDKILDKLTKKYVDD